MTLPFVPYPLNSVPQGAVQLPPPRHFETQALLLFRQLLAAWGMGTQVINQLAWDAQRTCYVIAAEYDTRLVRVLNGRRIIYGTDPYSAMIPGALLGAAAPGYPVPIVLRQADPMERFRRGAMFVDQPMRLTQLNTQGIGAFPVVLEGPLAGPYCASAPNRAFFIPQNPGY